MPVVKEMHTTQTEQENQTMLPKDPIILLSYINTHLRDDGIALAEFCLRENVSRTEIEEKMAAVGYTYNSETNRFE